MKRLATALLACLLSTQTLALTDEESKSAISNFYTQYVFGDKFLEKNIISISKQSTDVIIDVTIRDIKFDMELKLKERHGVL